MSDLLTHVMRSLQVDVDLDLEPQCESPAHEDGRAHGGPAEFWTAAPCGSRKLTCRPIVEALLRGGFIWCTTCGAAHAADSMKVQDL
jgi:hypothetical protein